MDDVGRYLWSVVLFILFTLIATVFSLCETAVVNVSSNRLNQLVEDGNKKAQKILSYKKDKSEFMLWTSISSAICMIISCFIGTYLLNPHMDSFLKTVFSGYESGFAGYLLTTVLVVFFELVAAKAFPKRIALLNAEKSAFKALILLNMLSVIFRPLTFLTVKAAQLLCFIFRIKKDKDADKVTEQDIRLMVNASGDSGDIEVSEREMINNIFEFDDRTVQEVMTHRTELAAVSKEDSIEDVMKLVIEEGFSRIPVYDGDIDNVVGIVYVKDLFELLISGSIKDAKLENYIRPAIYVPESTRCVMLFNRLKEKKTHMAVVVDEYGGTAGIVTMEDLIESIVGNIQDEYDEEEEEIKSLEDGTYLLDGSLLLTEVEKLFSVEFETDSKEDTDTLGGLIANTLGRILESGETPQVTLAGIEFTVASVEDRRIMSVKAKKLIPVTISEEE